MRDALQTDVQTPMCGISYASIGAELGRILFWLLTILNIQMIEKQIVK